jgi:prepilin-type N-terminal cleavage/methylation domain-containing protein
MHRRRQGFTLVELLVVIAIIGLLAALSLGALFAARQQAELTRARSMIERLDRVIQVRYESYRTRRVPIRPRDAAMARLMAAGDSAAFAYSKVYRGLDPSAGTPFPAQDFMAATRLMALREMIRLELPQRYLDIVDVDTMTDTLTGWPTCSPPPTEFYGFLPGTGMPALSLAYRRRIEQNRDAEGDAAEPTTEFESAECLYMIVTVGALDESAVPQGVFRADDVGDYDGDGMPEFHDAWGNPIYWVRWPAGFDNRWDPGDSQWLSDPNGVENVRAHLVSTDQPDPTINPMTGLRDANGPYEFTQSHRDPFDPLGVDGLTRVPFARMAAGDPPSGYRTKPLIFSMGPNATTTRPPVVDIVMDLPDQAQGGSPQLIASQLNDPYYTDGNGLMIGMPWDFFYATPSTGEPGLECLDNVHNHQPRER